MGVGIHTEVTALDLGAFRVLHRGAERIKPISDESGKPLKYLQIYLCDCYIDNFS